ncbi:MAG: proton-conducting transporter membrane subunit [Gemmatimonadota bacterium]
MIWIAAAIGLLSLAGLAAVGFRGRPSLADGLFRSLVLLGCSTAVVPALLVLLGGSLAPKTAAPPLPWGPWAFGLDQLSAWFLLVIGLAGAPSAVYGASYLGPERHHGRPVAFAHAMLALLLAAMTAVVTARAVLPFLMAWEVMAVSAYLLINFEGDRPEVRRAGLIYLVLTHAGTLALTMMFLFWGRAAPALTFAALAAASPSLRGGAAIVLLLATVGFGVKAGIVPVHFWLPGAHAAAPSHVSAVMSGIMVKTGIYGLLRVIQLLAAPPAWWGWLLLILGLSSGILGILWALGQRDLKRALAYSTVENVGLVFIALGVGVLGVASGMPSVALLGFAGALLHVLNHALFKSLLFLGAGAVLRATGTRALDQLGGLGQRMPYTAVTFAIGAVAVSGLPPLNGFISEWTIVRGLLSAADGSGVFRMSVLAVAAVGMIGALAVACFTRIVGTMFLGNPRAPREGLVEADPGPSGLVPMVALALGCVAVGAVPALALVPVAEVLRGFAFLPSLGPADLGSGSAITLMVIFLAVGALAVAWLVPRRATAESVTWGCGFAGLSRRAQYTASSYGAPILRAFGRLAAPPIVRGPTRLETEPDDRALRGATVPGWERVKRAAIALRPIRRGRLTGYLTYLVATVLILLLYLYATTVGK